MSGVHNIRNVCEVPGKCWSRGSVCVSSNFLAVGHPPVNGNPDNPAGLRLSTVRIWQVRFKYPAEMIHEQIRAALNNYWCKHGKKYRKDGNSYLPDLCLSTFTSFYTAGAPGGFSRACFQRPGQYGRRFLSRTSRRQDSSRR